MSGHGKRIGFIGLGKMGTPICHRIAEAGFQVSAYVRNEAGIQKAASINVDSVRSLPELVSRSDVIVSAISDDHALMDMVLGDGGLVSAMRKGMVLVETSTVSPINSARVGDALSTIGAEYLRAPVSGSTAMAASGSLTVISSGSREVFENLKPLFDAFSKKQYFVGSGEQARYMKLVLNSMVGATSAILAEALRVGRAGGIENEVMLEVINNSAVASPLIRYKTDMLVSGDFTPAFSVTQMMKDFDLLLGVGRESHCALLVMSLIRQMYETAFVAGDGERDFFVLAGTGDLTDPKAKR